MCANYVSILTGTTNLWFSRIHNSVIFYPIDSNVVVEVCLHQGRLHTKFEENYINHFRDMGEQNFFFFIFLLLRLFTHLKKIALIHKLWLKFNNLVGHPEAIVSTNFSENLYKILKSCLQGKPLAGSTWKLVCS